MADWKKVVVSGSNITQLNNDALYIKDKDPGLVTLSGSFSGSFQGDGSGLSGVSAKFPIIPGNISDTTQFFINDGTNRFASGSQVKQFVYSGIRGDATVSNVGVLTISSSAVEGTMLNSNVADGTTIGLTSNTLSVLKVPNALTAGSGLFAAGTFDGSATRRFVVDSGSMLAYYSSSIFATVSGDATINSAGIINVTSADTASYVAGANVVGTVSNATTAATASSVAANSVALGADTTGNYVASLGTGTGVTIGSNSGEGSNPTIAVNYGSSANQAVQGNTNITINGTTNEIDITGTAAQALGGAPSYTIGLADTINGNRTFTGDVTFASDIVVQGTASFQNTTNLQVADQFILLNSGSAGTGPGGIVIEQGTDDIGEAFAWSSAGSRWGVTGSFNASTTTFTPDAYVSMVVEGTADNPNVSGVVAKYTKTGNIYIDTDSSEVWIYV